MPKQEPFNASRTDRSTLTREETSREYRYTPPNSLPDFDPVEGFVFKWVRISTLGESDPKNVYERRHEGWEPIPAKDQPRVASHLGIKPDAETIEFGGLQACKNSVERANAAKAYWENRARLQGTEAKEKFRTEAQPVDAMPLIEERQTRVSRTPSGFGSGG